MQVTTTPENFKKAFKPYLVRWSIVYGIFMGFVTMLPVYFRWAGHDSELTYGPLTFGFNFVDIIAIGYNTAGIVAIGYNTVGVIAIGCNTAGIIAIGGNTVGIITIGYNAFGIFTLGYSERSKGKYLFAPHRQDAEAVSFFTRWLPKLRAVTS